MSATYRLTFTPELRLDGYRMNGETVELSTGDLDAIQAAWLDAMRRHYYGSAASYPMDNYATIGKLRNEGVPFALFVIGCGGYRVEVVDR